jgi:hypothetical protein
LNRTSSVDFVISEYEQQVSKSTAKEKEKQINKERQLQKKSMEPKAIPEKAPPPETKETNVPVTTRKIVADKVILVI